jgi:DNA repair exonuclease SbcCD ATPase subunit
MATLNELKAIVNRQQAKHSVLSKQLSDKCSDIKALERVTNDMVEARNLISEASRVTQEQFKQFVESLVTLAIQSVFPDQGYKFIVDFTLQSNKPQINLLVQQGDKEPYVPEDEQGGALLDVVSFALKIVMWSLEKPKSRNVLIFDEPFRWTGGLTGKAVSMMKEVSSKMGIQMIIVTHDETLSDIADRSWKISRIKGKPSKVELIGE